MYGKGKKGKLFVQISIKTIKIIEKRLIWYNNYNNIGIQCFDKKTKQKNNNIQSSIEKSCQNRHFINVVTIECCCSATVGGHAAVLDFSVD